MNDRTFIDQVSDMQRELKTLRAQNKAQLDTIGLLKKQYDDLAEDHKTALEEYQKKIHQAYTDRDVAERSASEIEGTLRVVAQQITEALRAKRGDAEPQQQFAPRTPQQVTADSTAQRLLRNTMEGGR